MNLHEKPSPSPAPLDADPSLATREPTTWAESETDGPPLASTTLTRARTVAARILDRIRRDKSDSGQSATDRPRVFADGELVAGRYRIIRLLARGGVGQVFEVEDQELGERVAFKTLHPRYASSPEAIEQFKREVLLARSVTHENVCRLFDFGRHPASTGSHENTGQPVFFVTMELLTGETLSERVRREGRLETPAALAIASDVALALATAHRKGVIHRDIKGSNVLLVAGDDGSPRAVVTDFGLALATAGMRSESVSPPRSKLEGTPLFMAPEQVTGGPVTTATDIYAFGVLLYNMLTGRWPFTGDTAVATAVARMEREPEPPSRLVQPLDPRLERLVLRCLERQPEARWASFDEIIDQLASLRADHQSPRDRPGPVRAARRRRTAAMLGLAAATTIALGLGTASWRARERADDRAGSSRPTVDPVGAGLDARAVQPAAADEPASLRAASLRARPSLIVLGFVNRTDPISLAWLATALEERFASALAAGGDLLLVDGEEAERVRSDVGLSAGPALQADDLARIGRRSGARWVLAGAYRSSSDPATSEPIQVEVRLQRTDGKLAPQARQFAAAPDNLSDLVRRASANLRAAIGIGQPTRPELDAAFAALPTHPEAARHYAEGTAALRRFETTAARHSLERAAALEPDNPLISLATAKAWTGLGYSDRARAAAELAFRHARSLPREKQLAIEAHYRLSVNEWQRAEELFRALRAFFPDDLDYGLALAAAQDKGARPEEALETLDALRSLPAPWRNDPRIDLTEAAVAYHHGDYPRSQQAAARAAETGRRLGAWTLVADALETEARTRINTDESLDRVTHLLRESRALYESVGHKRGLTGVLLNLGARARRRGDLEASERYFREGLALAEETGNQGHVTRAKTALGIILDRRGQLAKGLALKREVLANYQRRDVKQGAAIMLENLGISLLKLGRPKEALVQFQEAAVAFEAVGDAIGTAWAPYYQGRVWSDLGELVLAGKSFAQALEKAVDHPAGGLETVTQFELARIALARGELEAAEDASRGLIETFDRLDQPGVAAETRVLLARVLAARGVWPEAATVARTARLTLDEQREAPIAAAASIVLTRAALATDDDPTAACAELGQRLADLETMAVVLRGRVALARCAARAPNPPRQVVLAEIEDVLATAQALGLLEASLQARNLYAELLEAVGEGTRSRAEREVLRREARRLGWSESSWGP